MLTFTIPQGGTSCPSLRPSFSFLMQPRPHADLLFFCVMFLFLFAWRMCPAGHIHYLDQGTNILEATLWKQASRFKANGAFEQKELLLRHLHHWSQLVVSSLLLLSFPTSHTSHLYDHSPGFASTGGVGWGCQPAMSHPRRMDSPGEISLRLIWFGCGLF